MTKYFIHSAVIYPAKLLHKDNIAFLIQASKDLGFEHENGATITGHINGVDVVVKADSDPKLILEAFLVAMRNGEKTVGPYPKETKKVTRQFRLEGTIIRTVNTEQIYQVEDVPDYFDELDDDSKLDFILNNGDPIKTIDLDYNEEDGIEDVSLVEEVEM